MPGGYLPTYNTDPDPKNRSPFSAGLAAAGAQLRYGVPYAVEKLAGTLSPADDQAYRQGLAQGAAASEKALPGGPVGITDWWHGKAGIGQLIGENLKYSAPQMVATLGASVAGGLAGGPVGAAAAGVGVNTPFFVGSNIDRATNSGAQALTDQQAGRSVAVAPVQAATDLAAETFLPGLGGLFGPTVGKAVGKVIGGGGLLGRTARSIVGAGITEGVAETAQQVGERYSAALPVNDPQAMSEYVNAFGTSFFVGGAMGSLGGFGHHGENPLQHKAPAATTDRDLAGTVDQALQGQLALPAPENRLGLPSPSQFATPGNTAPVDAAGNMSAVPVHPDDVVPTRPFQAQPALPSPADFARPETAAPVDATGRMAAAPVDDAQAQFLAGLTGDQLDAAWGQIRTRVATGAAGDADLQMMSMLRAEKFRREQAAKPVEALGLPAPAQPAGPAVNDQAPLFTDSNARTAGDIPTLVAEPVDSAPTFADRLKDLMSGVRKNQFLAKLDAKDEADLLNQVHTQIFDNQDTRAGTRQLAQKLGLLDDNLAETDLARRVGEQRAAPVQAEPAEQASLVDPAFSQWWAERSKGRSNVLQNLNPTSEADLDAKLYTALGGRIPDKADGADRGFAKTPEDTDALETLAQERGLLDDTKMLTQKGAEIARRVPFTADEIAGGVLAQKIPEAQAGAFEAGVKAFQSGTPQPTFSSFPEMKAYIKGSEWAKDNVVPVTKSNYWSQEHSDKLDQAIAADPRRRGTAAPVDDRALIQQRLNDTIDNAGLIGPKYEGEVAALKHMVRNGAPEHDVVLAINAVKNGGTLFQQPARAPSTYAGEAPVRGAPRVQQEAQTRQQQGPQSKAAQQAETAAALEQKALFDQLDALHRDGQMGTKEWIGLTGQLLGNNLSRGIREVKAQLENRTGPTDPRTDAQLKVARQDLMNGAARFAITPEPGQVKPTPADEGLKTQVQNSNVTGTLEHLRDHGATPVYRLVAGKLLRGDWSKVDLAHVREDPEMRGSTRANEDGSSSIRIYGDSGMSQETVLHEALHAFVQQAWGSIAKASDRVGGALAQWTKLWGDVRDGLEKANPDLTNNPVWMQEVMRSPDEALSWVMTSPEAQAFLKQHDVNGSKIAAGKPSLWTRFTDFIRGLLGLPNNKPVASALDKLLDAGFAVLNQGAPTNGFADRVAASLTREEAFMQQRKPGIGEALRASPITEGLSQAADRAAEKIDLKGVGTKIRKVLMGFETNFHMATHYIKQMPALMDLHHAAGARTALIARFTQPAMGVVDQYNQALADKETAPHAKAAVELMAATALRLDPYKTWAQHTWLHGEPNEAALKQQLRKANNMVAKLREAGMLHLYDDFRTTNELDFYSSKAAAMHIAVAGDDALRGRIAGFETSPEEGFDQHAGIKEARDYWKSVVEKQLAGVKTYVETLRGSDAGLSPAEAKALRVRLSPLEQQAAVARENIAQVEQYPVFSLGRYGNHFVSFGLRTLADGKTPDPAAIDHIVETLAKNGFTDAAIAAETNQTGAYIRVETVSQRKALAKLALELQSQGWLSKDVEVKDAPRTKDAPGMSNLTRDQMRRFIDGLKANPAFDEDGALTADQKAAVATARAEMEAKATALWLDMLPDMNNQRFLTARRAVPGYSPDMVRNLVERFRVSTNATANLMTAARTSKAFTDMRATVNEAKTSALGKDVDLLTDLMVEQMKREAARSVTVGHDWIDVVRAANHNYFLSATVAYPAVNLTQIGVMLWPELVKRQGVSFAGAAKTIAKVTPDAFKVLRATFEEGKKAGWSRAIDAVITPETLKGVDQGTADFLIRMINRGTIDMGAPSREFGRIAEGSIDRPTSKAMRWGSALGLYSEVFNRLVAALAAREVYGDKSGLDDYAHNVVTNSMLDYSSPNVARQMGKSGIFGRVTPLITAFMQYSSQVTEKLYREVHDAFLDKDATPEERTAARKFLAAHLSAVTALTGTLGLPFATVFATAFEKLADIFGDDDQPWDATAAYRDWLAAVLGKDVAEVVARGLPRAAGVDVSGRAGEQDLLPFSGLMADKRSWKDALDDFTVRGMGAPYSMAMNMVTGAERVAQGDVMGGMINAMPVGFKAPLNFYRLTEDKQYTDNKGNKLPITPGAAAALYQLLGFTPAERAEYSESQNDQFARRTQLGARSKELRNAVVDAITSGDSQAVASTMAEIAAFDAKNPSYAVSPGIASSLQATARNQATARALQVPLGVSPKDFGARDLTGYANIAYQP